MIHYIDDRLINECNELVSHFFVFNENDSNQMAEDMTFDIETTLRIKRDGLFK